MNGEPTYGWLLACDEELVVAHLGVAELSHSYEYAKSKLLELIDWHVAVATDPKVNGRETVDQMDAVAIKYAHRLALELECVLADRNVNWDRAMNLIGEYRSAMNDIHEQHSPTFMGEPALEREVK